MRIVVGSRADHGWKIIWTMAGSSEVYGYPDRNIWLKRKKGLYYKYEWDHDQDHGDPELNQENLKLEP